MAPLARDRNKQTDLRVAQLRRGVLDVVLRVHDGHGEGAAALRLRLDRLRGPGAAARPGAAAASPVDR